MILERIRRHNIILILVIGFALLSFVISGVFSRNNSSLPSAVGEIDGEEIPYVSFKDEVDNTMRLMGGNASLSYAIDMLWENELQRKIFEKQFKSLGLEVGKEQIFNLISKSPSIAQDPQFQGENGGFDKNKFTQFITSLKSTNPNGYAQWQQQEKQLIESAKRELYMSLVRAGLGATAAEGEKLYHDQADKVSIKYAYLDYSSIPNEKIKVSDQEIQNYINSHKKEFEQEESTDIQFVVVREVASEQDKKEILDQISNLNQKKVVYNNQTQKNDTIPGFASMDREKVEDFVNANSDTPYNGNYLSKENLPVAIAETVPTMEIGGVYGPFEDTNDNSYKLIRLMDKSKNAQVRASHILLSYKDAPNMVNSATRTKQEAKQKAEELLEKVKSGTDISELVAENSDDKSSPTGDVNFFSKGQMVEPFEKFAFSASVGEVGVVETIFGYHVIKVTEQREGYQMATITRKIEPSEKTRKDIFAKISNFEVSVAKEPKKFSEIAKKDGLEAIPANNVEPLSETITGLGQSRELVRWTYQKDTKIGDVARFNLKDGYAVAQLLKKNEKGLQPVEKARVLVEPIIVKEKKAKEMIAKFKGNTIEQIAASINQTNISMAENITQTNPIITGVGSEAKVVGVAFALPKGKVSKPIVGENGVYVIEVVTKEIAPELQNYNSYINSLRLSKENSASSGLIRAMKENVEIIDNRKLFF